MLYDVQTPEEYLNALEEDWRRSKLMELRAIIFEKAPSLKESIQYKMLGFGDGKDAVFHLNAQKNYVSLYVGNAEKIDPGGQMLKGLDVGKGCIRFKKSVSISDTRIDEFIERTVAMWKDGQDIDC